MSIPSSAASMPVMNQHAEATSSLPFPLTLSVHDCATCPAHASSTAAAWVPTVGERFMDPAEFYETVKHYGQALGFTIGKSFTYNNDAQAIAKNNGIPPVKQGVIYCTSLPGKKKDKNCNFRIVFGFRMSTIDYEVTKVELAHTHTTKPVELDGRRHATKLQDLSAGDLMIIQNIAEYSSNFWKAKEHIARKIPRKHISGELFRCQFILARERIFGPNNGRIPQSFAT
jgi:hypothetical protein